jgi:hypothetical protein
MGKMVGGIIGSKSPETQPIRDKLAEVKAENEATATNDAGRLMAEELAGKKMARTRGGSRMLLSAERLNAQEGLSASTTLGG